MVNSGNAALKAETEAIKKPRRWNSLHFEPNSRGLQPNSDGLQPTSNLLAMASNLFNSDGERSFVVEHVEAF